MIDKIRANLMKTYRFLDGFCRQHGLKYTAAYGTVLGAVRHKGFIPWDDDIDLAMHRSDYDRLLSLRSEMQKSGYDIVSYADEGYYLPFAKVVDLGTTLWEHKQLPFLLGNFIDIFPMDCTNASDQELEALRRKLRRLFYRYQGSITHDGGLPDIIDYIRNHHYGSALRSISSFTYLSKPSKYLSRYTTLLDQYTGQQGQKCVYLTSGEPAVFRTEWFDNPILLPFEDMQIAVPSGYDEYLKILYGNWQTPPPANAQKATHGDVRYYINLTERLTLDQVRSRLAQGEHCKA